MRGLLRARPGQRSSFNLAQSKARSPKVLGQFGESLTLLAEPGAEVQKESAVAPAKWDLVSAVGETYGRKGKRRGPALKGPPSRMDNPSGVGPSFWTRRAHVEIRRLTDYSKSGPAGAMTAHKRIVGESSK